MKKKLNFNLGIQWHVIEECPAAEALMAGLVECMEEWLVEQVADEQTRLVLFQGVAASVDIQIREAESCSPSYFLVPDPKFFKK